MDVTCTGLERQLAVDCTDLSFDLLICELELV
jgi:hypothetical protein